MMEMSWNQDEIILIIFIPNLFLCQTKYNDSVLLNSSVP